MSARLSELLHREHATLAEFLAALAEFDRMRAWETLGYSSLFTYLHRELGLSKGAAFYRKTAAELVQRVPEVLAPLRDGRICITSVPELAKVLTPENRDHVLPRFFHRSKDEAREVVAELKPVERAPVRDVVTAVTVPLAPATGAPAAGPALLPMCLGSTALGESRGFPENLVDANFRAPSVNAPISRPERDAVDPLTAELARLHFTERPDPLRNSQFARRANGARRRVHRSVHAAPGCDGSGKARHSGTAVSHPCDRRSA